MINKQLNQIAFEDVEALILDGRQEDESLEFKRSISEGLPYSDIGDGKRKQALEKITREVVALLNTRGGDIVVGLAEATDGSNRADEIMPVQELDKTAEWLERGLSDKIEPKQENVRVKTVYKAEGSSDGALVIRVRASDRSPHRSRTSKDCFVRRGSETVPMEMTEIQEKTIRMSDIRLKQEQRLERAFEPLRTGVVRGWSLPSTGVHISLVALTDIEGIEPKQILRHFSGLTGKYRRDDTVRSDDAVDFFNRMEWRPVLRGRQKSRFRQRDSTNHQAGEITLRESGRMNVDYAVRAQLDETGNFIAEEWIASILASVLEGLANVYQSSSVFRPLLVQFGFNIGGKTKLWTGDLRMGDSYSLREGVSLPPPFLIEDQEQFSQYFELCMQDIWSVAGQDKQYSYRLA